MECKETELSRDDFIRLKFRSSRPELFCRKGVLNPIQDEHLRGCPRTEEAKRLPLHKICHTYPITTKLGPVTTYLKKIQKIYESRDTPLDFY